MLNELGAELNAEDEMKQVAADLALSAVRFGMVVRTILSFELGK